MTCFCLLSYCIPLSVITKAILPLSPNCLQRSIFMNWCRFPVHSAKCCCCDCVTYFRIDQLYLFDGVVGVPASRTVPCLLFPQHQSVLQGLEVHCFYQELNLPAAGNPSVVAVHCFTGFDSHVLKKQECVWEGFRSACHELCRWHIVWQSADQ